MKNKVAELALRAGVVGAGGAGFPTHVKLNTRVEYVILNGAECEPLITVDQVLLLNYAARLADMLEQVRQELEAKEAIIAIKAKHEEAIQAVNEAIKNYPHVRVEPLGDYYPAGDEVVLVYEVTGRQIPQGGIPLECGVVVINVETLWNLAEANEGRPVTKKWVTVAGAVKMPGTFIVPLGVSVGEMLELAGGSTLSEYGVINGGPMMGKLVKNFKEPVTKTTKGLLVLPDSNPVMVNLGRPLPAILKQAMSMCCQCHLCTDICPRNLLGYNIHPNTTILAAGCNWQFYGAQITQALLCSECGACDLYACPMGLSPRRVNQAIKTELMRQGVKNPYKDNIAVASQWRQYRRIPTKRLIHRLNLESYTSPAILHDLDYLPQAVEIPLKQHIGVPAQPVVVRGSWVEAGELVAKIPEEGVLSSNLFAGISGQVIEVTKDKMRIAVGKKQEEVRL